MDIVSTGGDDEGTAVVRRRACARRTADAHECVGRHRSGRALP